MDETVDRGPAPIGPWPEQCRPSTRRSRASPPSPTVDPTLIRFRPGRPPRRALSACATPPSTATAGPTSRPGRGPALLLIHGIGDSSDTWRPVVEQLAEHHTVIAPDLLGHGRSEKPRADYTVAGFANGMRDLLSVLEVDRVTVVGHSLGGGVAAQFAYQFPERCERLVLVGSGGVGPHGQPAAAPGRRARHRGADAPPRPAAGPGRQPPRARGSCASSTPRSGVTPRRSWPSSTRCPTPRPAAPSCARCARASTGRARSSPCWTAPTWPRASRP